MRTRLPDPKYYPIGTLVLMKWNRALYLAVSPSIMIPITSAYFGLQATNYPMDDDVVLSYSKLVGLLYGRI